MKIMWITSRHPPKSGGLAQSSGRIVNSLRDRGHAVTVLHLSRGMSPYDPATQGMVIVPDAKSLAEPERLFWICQNVLKDSVLIGFGGNQAGYYAALWAGWLGQKSMVLFRGNDFEKLVHDPKQSWMVHFILHHAGAVGAVSREMARRIRTMTRKPVVFTPNSIDPEAWGFLTQDWEKAQMWRKEHLAKDKPVIAMIGELKSKKGLDAALKLFTSFGFRERAVLLTVGAVPEHLLEYRDKSCGDFWIHVPYQKREELPVFYALSDIILMPHLYDGMPNVLLEAMALGRIVAASLAGAMPDVIQDGVNGFLFNRFDLSDMARVLDKVLNLTQAQRKQISNAAKERISECFQPKHEVSRIVQAISDVGASPGSPDSPGDKSPG
ncbi:MAG: hypothetical protein B6245_14235 [Desulfobacteraceae bacterium 4572_88]|nr:MAG: hypothetical protein B6245_14235 [Desulfobacteraceae bacterium 4572_88]